MTKENNITGLILAGGAGRRVQGQDKGLLPWRGKRLIEHVAERLDPQIDQLIVSCNRNIPAYTEIGDRQVQDKYLDFQGPLAGIEAAMEYVVNNILIVVACDTPLIPLDLVTRLGDAITVGGAEPTLLAYANDGKRDQYLSCAIHRSLFPSLGSYLEEGHRAVRHWIAQHPNARVDFSDQPDAFHNFNTMHEVSPGQT
ncbi:MAG: molybdenum cofactor guanylyltransferase MobA [Halioglobus sp.]